MDGEQIQVTMLYYELGDLNLKTSTKMVECNKQGAIVSDRGLPDGAVLVAVLEGACTQLQRSRNAV